MFLQIATRWVSVLGALAVLVSPASIAWGQGGGGGGSGGGGSGGGGNSNSTGVAGVIVDADGVLTMAYFNDENGRLTRQRMMAAKAALPDDVARQSKLRMVSLTRLEKALAEAIADGGKPTSEMLYLAGLTRIQYVFFYPDSGDVVIAGPAEGWFEDLAGRVVGLMTRRPVLELQDLVVVLRTYPPGGDAKQVISCSIDPTKEGLVRYRQFVKSAKASFSSPADAPAFVDGIRTSLGMQDVSFRGVPATSHFAQVLLEADYRMKLIGIGDPAHDFSRVRKLELKSFAQLADAAAIGRNGLCRWWFMPDYQCVRVSADRLAMELVGQGVKLAGEDEVVGAGGERSRTGKASGASVKFTQGFTRKYAQLSRYMPVYAQLRNLIDMSIVAAHIQKQDYYGKAGWELAIFGDEERFAVEVYETPVQVESAVTWFEKQGHVAAPTGGGVRIEAERALESSNLQPDEEGEVEKARSATRLDHLRDGQWWWD